MKILQLFLLLSSFSLFASTASICGVDERVPHFDSKIGRIGRPGILQKCTATMIGKKCAITAGHCVPNSYYVEFNTPLSINNLPQPAKPEDIYDVDQGATQFRDRTIGLDWAVLKLKANSITKRYPGEVYGYYEVSKAIPEVGDAIVISGYGIDKRNTGERNFTLQTAEGTILALSSPIFGEIITHRVDSMSGNSGSSIIRLRDQKIIGIHTHSGCDDSGRNNSGTLISAEPELQEAIKNCLSK